MRAPSGKNDRFEALILEHHVRLRAFVRSLGVDPDWVDDIAQEALMIAYREWASFDQERDFGKWVRGIAANITRNELRKQARRRRIFHTELVHLLTERHDAADDVAEPIALDAIRACLGELAPASLEIVRCRYRDGLPAPELAERLGRSAAAIRQSLVRIRQQLRACVELRVGSEA